MDEVHRGAFGVVEDPSPPLTEAEVGALPEGTRVVVIWTGGNGPHRYRITVDRRGDRYAWSGAGRDARLRFYNRLHFVGGERFHTRVWLDRT